MGAREARTNEDREWAPQTELGLGPAHAIQRSHGESIKRMIAHRDREEQSLVDVRDPPTWRGYPSANDNGGG